MKIGILTFHCAHNYGAVLQAYGLQEYLEIKGHNVEIIDYRPVYLTSSYKIFQWPFLRNTSFKRRILNFIYWTLYLPFSVFQLPFRIFRSRGFEKFISKNLNLSKRRFFELSILEDKYDVIIFGSDQIWSSNYISEVDSIFLGEFKTCANTLKIAYAASAGGSFYNLEKKIDLLMNFDAISVREENLAKFIEFKVESKIDVVLDPTFLVDKSVWEKILVLPKITKKYVLVYQVAYDVEADKLAKHIAKQIGVTVISIWAGYTKRFGMRRLETPEQFLGWFKNAECVVTTSFHGTAFSIIFQKQFYYVGKGLSSDNRAKQILKKLGLIDHYVLGDFRLKFSESVNTNLDQMEESILMLRSISEGFINKYIND